MALTPVWHQSTLDVRGSVPDSPAIPSTSLTLYRRTTPQGSCYTAERAHWYGYVVSYETKARALQQCQSEPDCRDSLHRLMKEGLSLCNKN